MSRSSYSRRPVDEPGPVYGAILIAIIIAIGFIVTQSGEARLRQSVQTQTDTVVSPIMSVVSRPIRAVETLSISFNDRQRAFEENKVLRAELRSLREDYASLLITRHKLSRYEEILSAKTQSDAPLKKVAARAVSDIKGPFVRALLVNAGTSDNIDAGQAVMSEEGMIGHIILAGSNASRVLRLDDLNSRIPVMSARSQSVAILAGDNTDNPKLLYVDAESDWLVGDQVMTSGDDGRLPRGLNIGRVSEARDGALRVEISGLKRHLDWVWVAQFAPIQLPSNIDSNPIEDPATETEGAAEGDEMLGTEAIAEATTATISETPVSPNSSTSNFTTSNPATSNPVTSDPATAPNE